MKANYKEQHKLEHILFLLLYLNLHKGMFIYTGAPM